MKKLPPAIASLVLAGLGAPAMFAQTSAPATTAPDETVKLTPFNVTATQVGRYSPTEAASGGRIAVSLLDAPQSISVVTRELIEDTGAMRLLTALQYSTGVVEGTIPNGQDRLTIRGFQIDGHTVDNFRSYSQANLDPVFIERIEVVKGPNAILAPSGVPGGTINSVTRRPQFTDNAGSLTLEAGVFDAQRVELDVNRVWGKDKNFAFRVVGAEQDTKNLADGPKKIYAIMPMFAMRSKTGAEFTFQWAFNQSRVQNYFGLPLDPTVGPNDTAQLLSGVDRKLNTFDSDFRFERRPEFRVLLTAPLFENISMRFAVRYTDFNDRTLQDLPSTTAANQGGAIDPRTGIYTPGFLYGGAPNFTQTVAAKMPRTLTRTGTTQVDAWSYFMLQNDYVHRFKNDTVSFTTLAGGAFDRSRNNKVIINTTKTPTNYDAFVDSSNFTLAAAPSTNSVANNYDEQVYASETLGLFRDRVTFNAGFAASSYDLATVDHRLNQRYTLNLHAQLRSYGVLFHPIPGTSLYYNYSENATPAGWPNSIDTALQVAVNGVKPMQTGKQNEFGARLEALNRRLFATLAYFDIKQDNFGIQNPGNLVSPAPVPQLPQLFSDRRAKGWEFELHYNVNQQTSIVGNITSLTNIDPHGVSFRGTANHSGAVMINYQFDKTSSLAGLSLIAGVDYLGKRPGDQASGVTTASTSTNVIANQPTFYLPARTLLNLSALYRFSRNWKFEVDVKNAFANKYLASALSRFAVVPGDPINVIGRLTYSF